MTAIAPYLTTILDLAVIALLLAACWQDIREFRIANSISLAIIAAFAIKVVVGWAFTYETLWDMSGAALILLIGYALWAAAMFGAGDIKLAVAVAAYVGFDNLLPFSLFTMLLGGVVAIILLAINYMRDIVPVAGRYFRWIEERRAYMPYGIAISLSAIIVITWETGARFA